MDLHRRFTSGLLFLRHHLGCCSNSYNLNLGRPNSAYRHGILTTPVDDTRFLTLFVDRKSAASGILGLMAMAAGVTVLGAPKCGNFMATMRLNASPQLSFAGGFHSPGCRSRFFGEHLPALVVVCPSAKQKQKHRIGCVANGIPEVVIDTLQHGVPELYSYIPDAAVGGLSELTNSSVVRALVELSDGERMRVGGASVLGWIYLTARPGVLKGALDTFVAAPVQSLIESMRGRRGWKRTDFVISDRLGEGSFGTVYAGYVLPKSVRAEDEFGRRGRRVEEFKDYKKFRKVILKKVHSDCYCLCCVI